MKGLTLKQMRYLVAVAKHGHFGNAAEACHVSQPALSQQIKDLEALVGVPLLERSARRATLTPFGKEFVDRVQQIVLATDDLSDFVRASHDALTGALRLGIIPTMAPYVLPRIARMIGENYPTVDLFPREAITRVIIEDLLNSNLDLALVALPIDEPALHEHKLFDEEFVLVRGERDADMPVPSPDQLREMRLLLLEEGHCFRDQAIALCDLNAGARDIMEASSLSTLVQMVSAGIGVTVIPDMAVPLETRSAAVSITRFPTAQPKRTVGMIWRKSNPLADQLAEISAQIGAVCGVPTG